MTGELNSKVDLISKQSGLCAIQACLAAVCWVSVSLGWWETQMFWLLLQGIPGWAACRSSFLNKSEEWKQQIKHRLSVIIPGETYELLAHGVSKAAQHFPQSSYHKAASLLELDTTDSLSFSEDTN